MTAASTAVVYRRVSTRRQGESGLGLDAQQIAAQAFARSAGLEILATYDEIETGKRHHLDNRPQLRAAIAHAKRARARLVIAKLDRLARSVYVVTLLQQSGVDFVCCDNPHANVMTIQILATMAEEETRAISARTKAALAAAKARGKQLGGSNPRCRNLTAAARQQGARAGADAWSSATAEAYADLLPSLVAMKEDGLSLRAIAKRLNEQGHRTRRSSTWNAKQVSRVFAYLDSANPARQRTRGRRGLLLLRRSSRSRRAATNAA